jgi:hypothetical protein
VYKLTKVCHSLFRWEKYKNPRPLQQCFKCQKFGHSSTHCGRPCRCVKCDGSHSTKDCLKPRAAPPKCVNCGVDHPANHGGCPVYIKHLEARTRRLPRRPSSPTKPPPLSSQFPPLRTPPVLRKVTPLRGPKSLQNRPLNRKNFPIPSLIDALKSIITTLNLHKIGAEMRTLATRLQAASTPIDKLLLIVDTALSYLAKSP